VEVKGRVEKNKYCCKGIQKKGALSALFFVMLVDYFLFLRLLETLIIPSKPGINNKAILGSGISPELHEMVSIREQYSMD